MKRNAFLLLAAVGVWAVAAQAAWPQAPDAAPAARAASVSSAQGSVPRLVQFAGTLKELIASGACVARGRNVCDLCRAGRRHALWSETPNVIADANGHYNTVLGAATPGEWRAAEIVQHRRVALARRDDRAPAGDAAGADRQRTVRTEGGGRGDARRPAGFRVCNDGQLSRDECQVSARHPYRAHHYVGQHTNVESSPPEPTGGDTGGTTLTGTGTQICIPRWTSSTALGDSVPFSEWGWQHRL